jgi:hypothetical protein
VKKLLAVVRPRRRGLDLRPRLAVVVALVLVAALVPGAAAPARADVVLQLVPSLGVGITDNAANSTMEAARATDGFTTVALAASGRSTGALTTHSLAYQLAYTRFFQSLGPSTLTNGLAWTSAFKPTARLDIALTASVLLSRLARVDATDLTTVMPQASVAGTNYFLSTAVGQTLLYQPTGTRTFEQGLTVAQVRYLGAPEDLPTTTFVQGRARAGLLVGLNNYFLDVQLSDAYTPVDPAMTVGIFASGHTLLGRVLAGWQRELSPSWSSVIAAGPTALAKPEGPVILAPAGYATLNFARRPWFATLTVAQQAAPNLFLGEATLNDQVLARLALPLTRTDLVFVTGFASYIYARLANDQGTLGRAFDQRTAGAAVSGRVQSLPFVATLQYTIIDQDGSALGGRVVPDLFRQTLILSVSGVFMWGKGTPPLFGGGP